MDINIFIKSVVICLFGLLIKNLKMVGELLITSRLVLGQNVMDHALFKESFLHEKIYIPIIIMLIYITIINSYINSSLEVEFLVKTYICIY